MRLPIPPSVYTLLSRLEKAGHSAYAVGGCVRDGLLGKTPSDWDICTSASPEETEACFKDLRTVLTGVRYGTVTVLYEGAPYEITTYRGESTYSDSRHPDEVVFLKELSGDLCRRDFTINAMAVDKEGNVTDLYGGAEDIRMGKLRCVGTPEERFAEDPLRILRGLRFAARLGFSVEEGTARAMHSLASRLTTVAWERHRKELLGLLVGKGCAGILREFSDVLFVLIPELASTKGLQQHNPHHILDVWEHTLAVVNAVEPEPVLRLAALFHDIGKTQCFTMDEKGIGHFYGHPAISEKMCSEILKRLRFDNETIRQVTALVRHHDAFFGDLTEKPMKRLISKLGADTVAKLLRLRRADALGTGTAEPEDVEATIADAEAVFRRVIEEEDCLNLSRLKLNGRDLMAMGIPAGPTIGKLLNTILDEVLDGRLGNDRDALVKYAQFLWKNSENH